MGRRNPSYNEKRGMPKVLKVILIVIGVILVFIAGIFSAYPVMRLYDWIVSLF